MEEEQIQTKKMSKKKITLIVIISIVSLAVLLGVIFMGTVLGIYGTAFFSSINSKNNKAEKYTKENASLMMDQILFYGDSITEMYDLDEYYNGMTVYNRAISGDRVDHMLERLEGNALNIKPKTFIFLGGANDLRDNTSCEDIATTIYNILLKVQTELPQTKIIVQSVYPVNTHKKLFGKDMLSSMTNANVNILNSYIKQICELLNITYLDVHSALLDDNGELAKNLTIDGLHVNDNAYKIITNIVKPHIC